MSKRDTYLKMTNDDLRAARVLTLAVKFFGAAGPVSASTIHADLYPELEDGSFKRQYLRDRELLSTFGIQVRQTGDDGIDTFWQVDEGASYVSGESLSEGDARLLYVLCHDLAYDQSFAYRDELRMALAKISQMYRGTAVPYSDTTPASQHKVLSVLVGCMGARHAVDATYLDAQGNRSKRRLAIFGSFGLRGNTYFVASRIEKNGTLTPDSIRTYRLDRFEKASEVSSTSYLVPADFNVSDYERLPFQIGAPAGEAGFVLSEPLNREVQRAMETQGTVDTTADSNRLWKVVYASEKSLAAWSIGAEIAGKSTSAKVRAAAAELLRATCAVPAYDSSLAGKIAAQTQPVARKRAGRTGSVAVARQLVALASSLSREGEVITAQNIADSLGVSFDDARHLIALVSMGSGESIDYLPVILSDDDDEVQLMEGALLAAPQVRLTRSETIALVAALRELGINEDDPLMQTLTNSYAAPAFSVDDIARSLETPSSTGVGEALRLCSKAISEGCCLRFWYLPVASDRGMFRHVVPQRVRRTDDSWYLDAYDTMREAERVFRLDRMSDISLSDVAPHLQKQQQTRIERMVTVRFDDPAYLDLFSWDGLEVLAREGSATTVSLPHYGGDWLARHLAACGGTVRTGDQALARQIADYTRRALQQLED